MSMTYVDGNVWNDKENGFYFEVKLIDTDYSVNDGKYMAIVEVAYDQTENAEVTTYRRRAYKDSGSITNFFTIINGLRIFFKYNPISKIYSVSYIVKEYETKGVKRAFVGLKERTQNERKDENVKNNVNEKKTAQNESSQFQTNNEVRHGKYNIIKACLESNIPVYLAGPAGSGKNFTVEQICKELGWDFYFSNSIQQEYKLTGFIDAGGIYHNTEFYKACSSKKDCVFFLDEIDASISEVLVLLNAAIANGYFEFPEGRLNLDKVHFVAAGNTVGSGADELYTGRLVIDQATLDRFAIINFGYDYDVELNLAKGDKDLVWFIGELRNSAKSQGIRATFSYRAIMMVVRLKDKLSLSDVIEIAVLKGIDKDTQKQLVNGAYFKIRPECEYVKAIKELVA